ncbi:MAG: spondin domain-containing protein [Woeseiaceae bacterium]|nr:spondin domain-containing protein [Woeseiaceae bacterium]
MKLNPRLSLLALASALLFAATANADDYRKYNRTYEVTITNITKGQVFSPPVLVTHKRSVALFEVGQPALDELAIVAEDGAGAPLADLVSTLPQVAEAQSTSAPIPPGGSAIYEISSRRGFNVLSVVSMMVNTNDALIAIDSEFLPFGRNSTRTYYALGYDAGSEGNNEDCAFIPGPACPGDSGNLRSTEDAEGYVHIHNGVHGIADLAPDAYDWRNPVARITIRRIR